MNESSFPADKPGHIFDTMWDRRAFISECAQMLQAFAVIAANSAWLGDDAETLRSLRQARRVLLDALPEARALVEDGRAE